MMQQWICAVLCCAFLSQPIAEHGNVESVCGFTSDKLFVVSIFISACCETVTYLGDCTSIASVEGLLPPSLE